MSESIAGDKQKSEILQKHQFDFINNLSVILDSFIDVVTISNTKDGIIYITPSVIKETGWTKEEMLNLSIFDLALEEDIPSIMESLSQLEKNNVVTFDWRSKTKSGVYGWVETTVRNVFCPDDDCIYRISSTRNIQHRKDIEAALQHTSDELTNLNKMKDKFLSLIAHDLKNPVFSIITLTEYLHQHYQSLKADEIIEFIVQISESAKSSVNLLENLLDWARSQSNIITFTPEKIKIRKLICDCWDLSVNMAQIKKINFIAEIPDDMSITADYRMFCTIFRNLLSNAVKFTSENGEIKVKAYTESEKLIITVKDNGIGMSREQLNYLFTIDGRKHLNGYPTQHGSGLGLLLCLEFINRHNGSLSVESKLGKGTVITISIPQSAEQNS